MQLLKKLEEIKQTGNYAVTLYYGEDIGCDDSDVKVMERNVKVIMHPVGYVGELRAMYTGTVKSLLDFDPSKKATIISNPPEREEYEKEGFYIWGTDIAIKSYKEK